LWTVKNLVCWVDQWAETHADELRQPHALTAIPMPNWPWLFVCRRINTLERFNEWSGTDVEDPEKKISIGKEVSSSELRCQLNRKVGSTSTDDLRIRALGSGLTTPSPPYLA